MYSKYLDDKHFVREIKLSVTDFSRLVAVKYDDKRVAKLALASLSSKNRKKKDKPRATIAYHPGGEVALKFIGGGLRYLGLFAE